MGFGFIDDDDDDALFLDGTLSVYSLLFCSGLLSYLGGSQEASCLPGSFIRRVTGRLCNPPALDMSL